jgi:SPP1 family predicted phage head-tail adaptor
VIEAGRLRHVIQIQTYTVDVDANGDEARTYTTFASVHADIVPMRGRELFAAQQEFSEANVRIEIRYTPGITEHMRAYSEGVYYDIVSVVDVDMRHVHLILYCKAGITDES